MLGREPGMHAHHDDGFRGDLGAGAATRAAWTAPRTWVTNEVLTSTLMNTHLRDNLIFLHDRGADLASAATITPTNMYHRVTGTTTINTITAPGGSGQGGNRILLEFLSAGCQVTSAGNVIPQGTTFTSTANGAIEFVYDDSAGKWVECGRAGASAAGAEVAGTYSTFGSVSVSATTAAAATTIVTCGAFTADGVSTYWVEWLCGKVTPFSASVGVTTRLFLDNVDAGIDTSAFQSGNFGPMYGRTRVTPAAGSRAYSVRGYNQSAGTATMGGGTGPGFARVVYGP